MKIETRIFAAGTPEEKRQVLLHAENAHESRCLDWALGSAADPIELTGSRQLSDGYCEDYIRLEAKAKDGQKGNNLLTERSPVPPSAAPADANGKA